MNYTRVVGLGSALRRAAFSPKPRMFDYIQLVQHDADNHFSPKHPGPSFRYSQTVQYLLFSIIRTLTLSLSTVQTQSLKPEDGTVILNTQRLARPSSPHFTIYQPQLTWIASIANRVTGVGLSVRAPLLLPAHFVHRAAR